MRFWSGQQGELWAGPYRAADLRDWSLDVDETDPAGHRWTVRARLGTVDRFRLAHSPTFALRLRFGRVWYGWPAVSIRVGDEAIEARGAGLPDKLEGYEYAIRQT